MAQVPTPGTTAPAPAPACRLDAYRLAVEFDRLVSSFSLSGPLRDQLQRASSSVALCLAEGYGRKAPREKRHLYSVAAASARECAAVLELLADRRPELDTIQAQAVLVRVVRASEGLVAAMDRR
ncbi:MAG: four helix bundle protein [Vicinamibacteria bacterium]|nr:four helix bundle protein [Vicinamibacteria bacterium]